MITRPHIKPISSNFEEMLKELPKPIVILEFWYNHNMDIALCDVLNQKIDQENTNNKGICVIDFVLHSKDCINTYNKNVKMFFRRYELGTYLIEENGLPHYDFVAKPTDIEYKILNISTNQNHIYVKGELVSI